MPSDPIFGRSSRTNIGIVAAPAIHQVYIDATPLERRVLNRAFFKRIKIGEESEITGTELTPVYEALSAWEPSLGQRTAPRKTPGGPGSRSGFVRPSSEAADQWYYTFMEPTAAHEPPDTDRPVYGRDSEVTAGLESIALAADAHREAIHTIMAEQGMTEAEARLELLKQVHPEALDERRSLERELQFDETTGVGSTKALESARETAEDDQTLAFIQLDLNNFGNYNKITSQEEGDELLKRIATTMNEVLASFDLPPRTFRAGGDEFVIIAPKDKAEAVRDKIEEAVGVQAYTGMYGGAEKTVVVSVSGTIGSTRKESGQGMQDRKVEHKAKYGGETSKLPDA